jgi:Pentapeptide repeats (8 copies)
MAGRAVLQVDQAAYLSGANLSGANLSSEDLRGANLSGANLSGANLRQALLIGARLLYARLEGAYLLGADLRDATLTGASLEHVGLVRTNLEGATISNCRVYGISAWDVILNDETKQLDLVVTPEGEPVLSVDNLEVAQFMYLLINNKKIQCVIETITSRAVLILGRFIEERKRVLDALRDELRKRGYVPILLGRYACSPRPSYDASTFRTSSCSTAPTTNRARCFAGSQSCIFGESNIGAS